MGPVVVMLVLRCMVLLSIAGVGGV
jgi:hypothetical protein